MLTSLCVSVSSLLSSHNGSRLVLFSSCLYLNPLLLSTSLPFFFLLSLFSNISILSFLLRSLFSFRYAVHQSFISLSYYSFYSGLFFPSTIFPFISTPHSDFHSARNDRFVKKAEVLPSAKGEIASEGLPEVAIQDNLGMRGFKSVRT